ncbi:hypothetical protein ACB092_08G049100 [Castanea dentata]
MRGKSSPSTPTPLQMRSPPQSESDTTKRELQIVSTSPFRLPDDWFIEFKTRRNYTASPGRVDKMAGKKWEDLEKDCLVNIFIRVGTESLLYDIPLVCKSWYRASLDPSCRQGWLDAFGGLRRKLIILY